MNIQVIKSVLHSWAIARVETQIIKNKWDTWHGKSIKGMENISL